MSISSIQKHFETIAKVQLPQLSSYSSLVAQFFSLMKPWLNKYTPYQPCRLKLTCPHTHYAVGAVTSLGSHPLSEQLPWPSSSKYSMRWSVFNYHITTVTFARLLSDSCIQHPGNTLQMSFYLTFTVGLCVGCCYGDEFLTIVSEQSILARRSTEDLGH